MQALSRFRARPDTNEEAPKRAGTPIDPHWVLAMCRRGWRTLLLATAIGLVIGVLLALIAVRPTWQSEALVVPDVDADPANPLLARDVLHEGAELAAHPRVLERVRDTLASSSSIEALDARVDAEADREAGVIRISARAGSGEDAATLANTVVAEFLELRRESERERLVERARARSAELVSAEEGLRTARLEYDEFRGEHGISDVEEERGHAIAEAARLRAEADAAAVEATTSAARMDALRSEARQIPRMQVASASSTDMVGNQLAEARAELARARSRYTEDHPALQAIEARIAGLEAERRRGRTAVSTDSTSAANPVAMEIEGNIALAAADRATATRENEGLRRLADEAQERVASLSAIEGQASLLLAAVRIGERQVDALRADISQSEDRANDPPAGFRVAAPATPPESALASKARKIAVVAPPMFAFLFAFGWLFWKERGGARTRSPSEIAWWGHAPVIGTTTWPNDPEALDLLVAELEDLGTYAGDRTLVVPATHNERDAATEFAARLAEAPWLAAGVIEVHEPTPIDPRARPFRATLPTPTIVTPAPPPRERRASLRLMRENVAAASSAPAIVGGSDENLPRRITGRFELSAPTMLAGPDVRIDKVVRIGDAPVEPRRAVHVEGTTGVEGAERKPFAIATEVPQREDAVLMLAMRILGDAHGDEPEVQPSRTDGRRGAHGTVIDLEPPRHRASDPAESRAPHEQAVALAWTGSLEGPTMRRAARLADRVIVVVRDGSLSPAELAQLPRRLGREDAIGFLVIGVDQDDANRADRVGDVAEFWTARKRLPG